MKQNFTYKGLTRLYFIMRVSLVNLILLVTPCLQVLNASPVNGQNVHDTFVNIDVEHVSLKELFKTIENQTDFLFVYSPGLVESYSDVSFIDGHVSVYDVLAKLLNDLPLSFKESKGNILLFSKRFSIANNIAVQSVTGRVIEASTGTGLPGVSIIIKGTTNGTTTDADGRYSIDTRTDDILIFSSVGFKNQEIPVGGRSLIDLQMEDDVESLKEVVINGGYYTTTMETKVGNIVRVAEKEIRDQPVTSPLLALQGRAAGVDVYPNSGIPGSGPSIKIRGQNSLSYNGASPLYVVDGVPVDSNPIESSSSIFIGEYDPLSTINPANIESIDILKDADATAVYGSRGANGVILITTKRASQGKTSADFNVYRGLGQVAQKMDLLGSQEYLEMRREAFRNNNNQTKTQTNAPDLLLWDTTRYTDWQKVLLGGTADIVDLQSSISGGNSATSFRLGGGFHKEGTIFPGDFYFQRFTGSFTLNHLSRDNKFRATVSANYGVSKNHFFDASSPVTDALNLPPVAPPIYQEDGALNWAPNSLGGSTWGNPLAQYKKANDAKINNLIFNSTISYNVGWGLMLKANLGYTDLVSSEILKNPVSAYDPGIAPYITPTSIFSNTSRGSWIVEPQILFSKKINSHGVDAIFGTTFQEGSSEYKRIDASGYASDALLGSLQAASVTTVISDNNSQYRYTSAFARISYDFKERYFINLTGRRDGSSRFGSNNRFGNFGSVGVGWIFSKENLFVDRLRFVTFGKLRGSLGTTGNDQIGDYRYLNTYSVTGGTYHGSMGLVPTSLYNPSYKWEVTSKAEFALELSVVKNRISLEVAWYRNRSSNQLTDYQLPSTTGFGNVLQNLDATIENSGLEYTLSLKLLDVDDGIKWSSAVNYSRPTNELTQFSNIDRSPYANDYIVGQPLSVRKLYKYTGVNVETGLYTFLDVNSDASFNNDDRVVIKNIGRSYFGGVSNTFSYKSLELNFLFQFVRQTVMSYSPNTVPGRVGNIPKYIYDNRWRQNGDLANVQKMYSSSLFAQFVNNINSDNNVESASFVRLKTLSLSYSFPVAFLEKIKVQQCRVYLQGQNLMTFSDYRGLDPETGSSVLPPLKQVMIGIQIGI